jgi:hypothetical protein
MIARELWWTNQEYYPVYIIPPWFSMLLYHQGMNSRPVGDHSSETYSHSIDMIIVVVIIIIIITVNLLLR